MNIYKTLKNLLSHREYIQALVENNQFNLISTEYLHDPYRNENYFDDDIYLKYFLNKEINKDIFFAIFNRFLHCNVQCKILSIDILLDEKYRDWLLSEEIIKNINNESLHRTLDIPTLLFKYKKLDLLLKVTINNFYTFIHTEKITNIKSYIPFCEELNTYLYKFSTSPRIIFIDYTGDGVNLQNLRQDGYKLWK